MTFITVMPKEIFDTIEQVKADCEKLKQEKGLTAFGEGQLQLANILMDFVNEWKIQK